MPATAGGKAACATLGFARSQCFHTAAQLILACFIPQEGPLLVSRKPVSTHTELREFSDTLSQLQRRLQSLATLRKPIDQPNLQRFVSSYATPGKDEIERPTVPDHAGKTYGAEVDEWDTPAAIEDAKNCISGGDAEVA